VQEKLFDHIVTTNSKAFPEYFEEMQGFADGSKFLALRM